MQNRLIILLLVTLSVLLFFSPNVDSQDPQETVVRVAPHALEENTQTVDIIIKNGQNVVGYQVVLQFDSASLTFVESEFQHGDYLSKNAFFGKPRIIDKDPMDSLKIIRFTAISFSNESNGNGILATLKFNKSGPSALTLLGNIDGTLLANKAGEAILPRLEHSQASPAPVRDLVVESVQVIPIDAAGSPAEEARYVYNKGEKYQLRTTVSNEGNVLIRARKLKIYHADSIPIDTEMEPEVEVDLANLDILISPNRTTEISVPDAIVTAPNRPGNHYYHVCVESTLSESNPDNNCSAHVEITVESPDLEDESIGTSTKGSVCTKFHLKSPRGGEQRFWCVAYSPDGSILAGGSKDNYLYLWDAKIGKLLYTFKEDEEVYSIAFSPMGDWIAIGGKAGKIRMWKKPAHQTWAETANGHNFIMDHPQIQVGRHVWSVAFSHDGTRLACGKNSTTLNASDTIDVWSLNGDTWTHEATLDGHSSRVNSVAFHPKYKNILASASDDDTVALWDINRPDSKRTELYTHDGENVNSLAFSPSGKYLASGGNDNTVKVWNVNEEEIIKTFVDPESDDVLSVAFISDTQLLSGGFNRSLKGSEKVRKWTIDSIHPEVPTNIETEQDSHIYSIAFNPEFNSIAIGIGRDAVRNRNGVLQLTCTEEGNFKANDMTIKTKLVELIITPDLISDVAYSKHNTYFVLDPHFVLMRGMENIEHGKCTITLDTSNYWMFLLEPEPDKISQIADFAIDTTLSIIAFIPKKAIQIYSKAQAYFNFFTDSLEKIDSIFRGSDTLLKVEINPKNNIPNLFEAVVQVIGEALEWINPSITYPYFCIIPGTLSGIDITIEQEYNYSDRATNDRSTYTVTYKGTWNLEETFQTENPGKSAPSAKLMSLADYPPFQQLPPEVQEYLLQHLERTANPNTLNPELWQIPEKTSLLPNYPNPFNPETWIPYQLAKSADVTLTIYDIKGQVVRNLDLGHQRAGIYQSRARAAHWDGKNTQGEAVASGVYFYTLQAGEFSATRKMLIQK